MACAPARRFPACDAECADRRSVTAVLDRYAHALTLVNADSVAAYYADDGALLQPGSAPIVGRPSVRAFLAPFDGKVVVAREVILVDSTRRTDGAIRVWGTFEQVAGERGGAMQTSRGAYVADFVRGAGAPGTPAGAWSIERFANLPADGRIPTYSIDHVILGSADLERGMLEFAERTGVAPQVGGVHPGRGTRNALASLGNLHYLEILAPDHAQGHTDRNAALGAYAHLSPEGWAIRTSDIEATARTLKSAKFSVEGPLDGARVLPTGTRLAWRTLNVTGPASELLPFFIEWQTMDVHPSRTSPAGCTLGEVAIAGAHDDVTRALMRTVGIRAVVTHGVHPAMRVTLACGGTGRVVFER